MPKFVIKCELDSENHGDRDIIRRYLALPRGIRNTSLKTLLADGLNNVMATMARTPLAEHDLDKAIMAARNRGRAPRRAPVAKQALRPRPDDHAGGPGARQQTPAPAPEPYQQASALGPAAPPAPAEASPMVGESSDGIPRKTKLMKAAVENWTEWTQ
jgi:hypothetical protein